MTQILIVDDDDSVRKSIRLVLRRSHYQVVTADGADTGLEALERTAFDLLIVDVCMPRMRGFESIRIFHQQTPRLPLIAISGYTFSESFADAPNFLSMAIELGAWRCMRKPFTAQALLFVVKECLTEARLGPHCAPNRQSQPAARSMKARTLAESNRDVG